MLSFVILSSVTDSWCSTILWLGLLTILQFEERWSHANHNIRESLQRWRLKEIIKQSGLFTSSGYCAAPKKALELWHLDALVEKSTLMR